MALQDHPMWRKPQNQLDADHRHNHVHWVELFYDLVHVVTIFLLGNYLSDHLTLTGFFQFAVIFTALWFAWSEINVYNALYVSTDIVHRLTMAALIITVMFMAAAIPAIVGKGWPYFAVAFAVNRFLIGFLYFRTMRAGVERSTSMAWEMTRNMWAFAIFFAITAFLPNPWNYYVFIAGLIVNQLIYMIPSISISRYDRFAPDEDHFVERFSLMTLIVLGEGFFKLVITLSEKGIYKVGPDVLFNFTMGGISTFAVAWLYFDFFGNAKPKTEKARYMVTYWLGHLLLMLCALMLGVALAALSKVGLIDVYPYEYAVIGCIGLAGYLLSLGLIQWSVEPLRIHDFSTWRLRLFGIATAVLLLIIGQRVNLLVANLLWSIALLSQILVPLYLTTKLAKNWEKNQPE